MGLMSWGTFPDGRRGLSSVIDLLQESSSLDPLLESFILSKYSSEHLLKFKKYPVPKSESHRCYIRQALCF